MTAADLLKHLATNGFTVSVVDGELAVEPDAPADLDPIIGILALPLLALLTGRRLYAIDKAGRGCVRPDGIAEPQTLLPTNVRLLAVEGLTEWDRVSEFAVESYPDLFAPALAKKGAA